MGCQCRIKFLSAFGLVMLNRPPPLEETPEVLLKIHLRSKILRRKITNSEPPKIF